MNKEKHNWIRCWAQEASERPDFTEICDTLETKSATPTTVDALSEPSYNLQVDSRAYTAIASGYGEAKSLQV